jgi:hypothetical protein
MRGGAKHLSSYAGAGSLPNFLGSKRRASQRELARQIAPQDFRATNFHKFSDENRVVVLGNTKVQDLGPLASRCFRIFDNDYIVRFEDYILNCRR